MPFFNWNWSRKTYPPFYRDYQERLSERWPLDTPVEELRFVVFDTETTGLNPRKDLLLSIGAVEVTDNAIRVNQIFDHTIRRTKEATQQVEAIEVHGILPGEHPEDQSEEEAISAFLDYLGNAILVAHHVRFDVLMIEKALNRYGGGRLLNQKLDTVELARRAGSGTDKAYNLDALGRRYGIPLHDRHTAAGDAYITAILLLKLLQRLKKRRVRTLRDLLR